MCKCSFFDHMKHHSVLVKKNKTKNPFYKSYALFAQQIGIFLLLKIQTSRTADTTDKFVEDLLPHNENTPADCGTLFFP